VPLIAVLLAGVVFGALACGLALAPRLFRLRARGTAVSAAPASGPDDTASLSARRPVAPQANERVVDAARNVGAVGELDPDTRFRR